MLCTGLIYMLMIRYVTYTFGMINPWSALLTYIATPLSALLTYMYMLWYHLWGNLHKIGSSKDFLLAFCKGTHWKANRKHSNNISY